KPNTEVATYFYENTTGKFFNILFNKEWANINLPLIVAQEKEELDYYHNNEPGFINWIDIVPGAPELSTKIWEQLEQDPADHENNGKIKTDVQELVAGFFKHAFKDKRIKNHT